MDLSKLVRPEDYFRLDCRLLEDCFDSDGVTRQLEGQANALRLFHEAARRVPAYREFLRRHGINPADVRTAEEYRQVPATDKKNYIDRYPLEELVWDGSLAPGCVINASSGTTGAPYFWPCSAAEMAQAAALHELIYRRNFALDITDTLLVISFGMGTWIAGSYTSLASQMVSQKGHPLTVMTPGFNKEECLRILNSLSPKFAQTIVAGIPSFVKDLVDACGRTVGGGGKLKFLLAGEGFTETWRDHVVGRWREEDCPTDAVGVLGSADAGLVAFETPRSVLIRRLTANDQGRPRLLFGRDRLPALFQYVPTHRFFEEEAGELLVTAERALPLLRYNTHDQGGVLAPEAMRERLGRAGIEIDEQRDRSGARQRCSRLPFVYLFGRGQLAATLYGANIYAEHVQELLIHASVADRVTGRFTLETRYDENQDQRLHVHVELREHDSPDEQLSGLLAALFVRMVRFRSSEYNRIWQEYGDRASPRVVLHPYGAPSQFPKNVLRKTT
jgi:phenylacetate-CoA ligase